MIKIPRYIVEKDVRRINAEVTHLLPEFKLSGWTSHSVWWRVHPLIGRSYVQLEVRSIDSLGLAPFSTKWVLLWYQKTYGTKSASTLEGLVSMIETLQVMES
mgnify:CR=1 FL=1